MPSLRTVSSRLIATAVLSLGLVASVQAATTVGVIGGAGLDIAEACPNPAGSVCGGTDSDFSLVSTVSVTGVITLSVDPGVFAVTPGTANVLLTLTGPASLTANGNTNGNPNGAVQVDFTSATYSVTGLPILAIPAGSFTNYVPNGTAAGDVDGSYEQFDVGAASIDNANFVDLAAIFSNMNCLLSNADASGGCGVTVGPGGFTLGLGPTGNQNPYDFSHTFNVIVPEPASGLLVVLGALAGLSGVAEPGFRGRLGSMAVS